MEITPFIYHWHLSHLAEISESLEQIHNTAEALEIDAQDVYENLINLVPEPLNNRLQWVWENHPDLETRLPLWSGPMGYKEPEDVDDPEFTSAELMMFNQDEIAEGIELGFIVVEVKEDYLKTAVTELFKGWLTFKPHILDRLYSNLVHKSGRGHEVVQDLLMRYFAEKDSTRQANLLADLREAILVNLEIL